MSSLPEIHNLGLAGLGHQQALREAKQGSAEASPLGFALFFPVSRDLTDNGSKN